MNSLGLNLPSRACAPLVAVNNASCWLLGTTSLRGNNEVVQVESSAEGDPLRVTATYSHPAEVWDVDASPLDGTLFGTVFQQGGKSGAALWKAQPLANKAGKLCDLCDEHSTRMRQLLWHPHDASLMLTLEDAGARVWQLRGPAAAASGSMLAGETQEMLCVAWDPHGTRLCTAEGRSIQVWDLRQRQQERLVSGAHPLPVRHLDFAWQRQDVLASCGDDGRVRVWDLRAGSSAAPLLDLVAATHWVWKVSFNPCYDNLLISGSSDSTCALWHLNLAAASAHLASTGNSPKPPAPAVAAGLNPPAPVAAASPKLSAPVAAGGPQAGGAAAPPPAAAAGAKRGVAPAGVAAAGCKAGGAAAMAALSVRAGGKPVGLNSGWGLPPTDRLQHYTGHQSSVYQVSWSAVDPWTYASLSFDGQLVLHSVPNSIKYKLLI